MARIQVVFGRWHGAALPGLAKRKYTYDSAGLAVGVGDIVQVPANHYNATPGVATVVELESSYPHDVDSILAVLEKATS